MSYTREELHLVMRDLLLQAGPEYAAELERLVAVEAEAREYGARCAECALQGVRPDCTRPLCVMYRLTHPDATTTPPPPTKPGTP